MKKSSKIMVAVLMSMSLSACSLFSKESDTTSSSKVTTVKPIEDIKDTIPSENVEAKETIEARLKFNEIQLGDVNDEAKVGTNLKTLKKWFGEPTSKEDREGGDVTINVYTWEINGMNIVAQLYEDSTIAKSVSYFSFTREKTLTMEDYDKLEKGMSYEKVVDLLGEPDVMAHSISSNGEELNAIWTSNLNTTATNPGISVDFEGDKLVSKSQNGLD